MLFMVFKWKRKEGNRACVFDSLLQSYGCTVNHPPIHTATATIW